MVGVYAIVVERHNYAKWKEEFYMDALDEKKLLGYLELKMF